MEFVYGIDRAFGQWCIDCSVKRINSGEANANCGRCKSNHEYAGEGAVHPQTRRIEQSTANTSTELSLDRQVAIQTAIDDVTDSTIDYEFPQIDWCSNDDSMVFDWTTDSSTDSEPLPAVEQINISEALWSQSDTKASAVKSPEITTLPQGFEDLFDMSSWSGNAGSGCTDQGLHAPRAPIAQMLPVQSPIDIATRLAVSKQHDCLQAVLRAALTLHQTEDICISARTGTPPPKRPSSSRTMDDVLLQNRETIRIVSDVLNCPCATDQDVALACCVVAIKVVSWYETAMDPPQETAPYQRLDHIDFSPIVMGKYTLTAGAHRAVLAQIVLSELRDYVQPLLAKIPEQRISPARMTGSALAMASTLENRTGALKAEVRRVMTKANGVTRNA